MTAIVSLESVPILAGLDGRHGSNRASGNRPQIAATTDIDAIKAWLARFADTPTTFDNYRKEAERLLPWSTMAMGKPVSSLTHEDLLAYQRFPSDPQPAHLWVMQCGRKVARSHPDWRPFAGPLAPSSQRQAIVKKVFENTANRLRLRGGECQAIAERVEQASAH